MAFRALIFLVVGLPYTLFNVGGSTPGTGTGDVLQGMPATGRATLSIKSMRPLVVAGRGFKRGERVRVSGAGTKNVTATHGAFSVRLGSGALRGLHPRGAGIGGQPGDAQLLERPERSLPRLRTREAARRRPL